MTRMTCLVDCRVVRPVNTTVRITDQKKHSEFCHVSVCMSVKLKHDKVEFVEFHFLSLKAYFKFILRAINYALKKKKLYLTIVTLCDYIYLRMFD